MDTTSRCGSCTTLWQISGHTIPQETHSGACRFLGTITRWRGRPLGTGLHLNPVGTDLTSFSLCLLRAGIRCKSQVATANTTYAIGLRTDGTWRTWIGIWRAAPIYGQSIWNRKQRIQLQTASLWKSKRRFHPTATGSHLRRTKQGRVRSTCKLFRVRARNAKSQVAEAKS